MMDRDKVDLSLLNNFFKNDGIDVFEGVKYRFKENSEIIGRICRFEQKYYQIDTDD